LQQQAGLQEAEYNRNLAQAEAQQGIEARKAEREKELYDAQLTGAQAAARQAEINRQNAIEGAVKSGASALGSFGEAIPLFFNQKENLTPPIGTTTGVNSMGQQMSYAPGYNPNANQISWNSKTNNQGIPAWILNPFGAAQQSQMSSNNYARAFQYLMQPKSY